MATLTGYLAPDGLDHELRDELARAGVTVTGRHDRLVLSPEPATDAAWAANVWPEVERVSITSIGHAARELRDRQRNWAMYAPLHSGRARLIAERLPHVSARPLTIGASAPEAPLGSWTLLDPDVMLVSARCTSPFPNGEARLVEDREGPPSRAYLKVWEALSLLRQWPGPGELCLDLGASPGGWTWLLAQTGAAVIAVDKAPLAPTVEALPGVSWRPGSAFGLDPLDLPPVDWLFSDIICYPKRLLGLIERWRVSGRARNIVATIKFQGPTDHDIVSAFRAISGAKVFHLHHNKHELTVAILDRPG
jgi:23S rRNA (cytidine2498-2'-O)-methyltransferase